MKPSVYMSGDKVEEVWEDSRFQSTLNLVSMYHDRSFDAKMKYLSVVEEPLAGEPVRRFQHLIQRTMEDFLKKVHLAREVTPRRICRWCLSNIICLMWVTTYETDQKYGTKYHERFVEYAFK